MSFILLATSVALGALYFNKSEPAPQVQAPVPVDDSLKKENQKLTRSLQAEKERNKKLSEENARYMKLLAEKQKKENMKWKGKKDWLCVLGCNLLQTYEAVVGFECLSNLAHVGDVVLLKTVDSAFTNTQTQNEGKSKSKPKQTIKSELLLLKKPKKRKNM